MKLVIIPTFCLIFLVSFYCKAYSDQLYLKGSHYGIDVTIKKSDKESITVIIPKKQMSDIMINSISIKPYPDIIKLQNENEPLSCKVLETDDNAVMVHIPIDKIASFNITLPSPKNDEDVYTRSQDRELSTPETRNHLETRQLDDNNQIMTHDHGMIKGTILSNGNILPKCQVKIYRLIAKGFFLLKSYKQAEYYETITDNNGNYMFKDIPAGAYKLHWRKSLGEPWMSRIETEPDVIVYGGKIATISPLDIDYGISD